ncbi:hypothetical protein EVAR_75959_1 [Eumeta japonica]|uniref:Uncharacterized protein n=1 Tax=Eumeta variegata TaxID=151549 RepID=A0A4C1UWC3_EUMVA|nr:hypothetical protein EVAR_75959_1 [Eumeta japonica]
MEPEGGHRNSVIKRPTPSVWARYYYDMDVFKSPRISFQRRERPLWESNIETDAAHREVKLVTIRCPAIRARPHPVDTAINIFVRAPDHRRFD